MVTKQLTLNRVGCFVCLGKKKERPSRALFESAQPSDGLVLLLHRLKLIATTRVVSIPPIASAQSLRQRGNRAILQ